MSNRCTRGRRHRMVWQCDAALERCVALCRRLSDRRTHRRDTTLCEVNARANIGRCARFVVKAACFASGTRRPAIIRPNDRKRPGRNGEERRWVGCCSVVGREDFSRTGNGFSQRWLSRICREYSRNGRRSRTRQRTGCGRPSIVDAHRFRNHRVESD